MTSYKEKGYFYIRTNSYWNSESENYYKTGITQHIKNRQCPYITTEKTRGKFIKVIEFPVDKKKLKMYDDLIKLRFNNLNIRDNGGTEFYNKDIINLIEGFLNSIGIKYKVLTDDEIDKLNRFIYLKNVLSKNIIVYKNVDESLVNNV